MTNAQEEKKWDRFSTNYDSKVFSITKNPKKRERILKWITPWDKVLIVWCWPEIYLQKDIIDKIPWVNIVATDFNEKMINEAKGKYNCENLRYVIWDTRNLLFWDGKFDTIISTNSIIPETREEVVEMYKSIIKTLRIWWKLLAYLPSFNEMIETAEHYPEYKKIMDFVNFRLLDTTWWQCFHTMESIFEEMTNVWFTVRRISKIWVEWEKEYRHLKEIYWTDIIPKYYWGYFAEAIKNL